ncbi:MAG: hypothetical protein ACM3WV_01555 [Bacillota bacterium]
MGEGKNPAGYPAEDIKVLHELAKKVAEAAALPEQEKKRQMWYKHNALQRVRPMILVFPEGSWKEICELMFPSLCKDQRAAKIEWELRKRLFYHEFLQDDSPIEAVVQSPIVHWDSGFGIWAKEEAPDEKSGAKRFIPVIAEESDIDKITNPQVYVDWEKTEADYAALKDALDGILPVAKGEPTVTWTVMLDTFATWRGIDQMYLDLYDRPAWVHEIMRRLTEANISRLKQLERMGILRLNNREGYVGSGGVAYTHELPQPDFDGTHVRLKDLYGFSTTQTFTNVSPAMHDEFALQYEIRFLELFGLNCYGCCEPLHHKMEYVKKIPRLRRVSISPWADLDAAARELEDKYIFSNKPNPEIIARNTWEPEEVRRDIRMRCEKTRGCVVEIIMKDTHTCRREPRRLREWVRIAREVAEEYGG